MLSVCDMVYFVVDCEWNWILRVGVERKYYGKFWINSVVGNRWFIKYLFG